MQPPATASDDRGESTGTSGDDRQPGRALNFFVGIGAQKAATSWLADYLDSHPQVGFSPIKEMHYFDMVHLPEYCGQYRREMEERLVKLACRAPREPDPKYLRKLRSMAIRVVANRDPGQYRRYFEQFREPGHAIVGEITPSYCMLDAAGFAAIRRMMPGARFIFILRDPLARYLSQVRFTEAQKQESGFKARERVLKHLYDPQYTLRSDYRRTLEELEQVVPAGDICVVFYEQLMSESDGERVLREITRFLGVPYRPGNRKKKVNVGRSVRFGEGEKRRVVRRFAGVYEYVFERYGDAVPPAWRESYQLLGSERGALERWYEDRFKPHLVRFLTRQRRHLRRFR